jgi:hypothetical protein
MLLAGNGGGTGGRGIGRASEDKTGDLSVQVGGGYGYLTGNLSGGGGLAVGIQGVQLSDHGTVRHRKSNDRGTYMEEFATYVFRDLRSSGSCKEKY